MPTWTNAGKIAASSAASAATPHTTSASSKNGFSTQVCQPSFFGSQIPVLRVLKMDGSENQGWGLMPLGFLTLILVSLVTQPKAAKEAGVAPALP
jgi:hypothetical protein